MHKAAYLLLMQENVHFIIFLMNCPGPVYKVDFFILQWSYSISLNGSYLNPGVVYNS